MRQRDLMNFLVSLEPGLEGTSTQVVQDIDRLHLKGRIRKWIQFLDLLKDLRNETTLAGPFDSREARAVIGYMPVIDPKTDK